MVLSTDTVDPATALGQGLRDIARLLDELHEVDLHEVGAPVLHEVVADIELLSRRAEALSAKTVAVVEAEGLWATGGARSYSAWLPQRTGRHGAAAARMVQQARALRDHLPGAAAAWAAGQISSDHVSALTRHAIDTPDRLAQLADPDMGEEFLLGQAKAMDASSFTTLVRHWGLRADPEAADRAWKADSERQELTVSPTTGGYHITGWLDQVSGQSLITALDARTGLPGAGATRSRAQRRATALVSLSRLALDSGKLQPGARIRPHLAITVPFETLQSLIRASTPHTRGTHTTAGNDPQASSVITSDLDLRALTGVEAATLPDGQPIPHTLLARLACHSQMHRVIFGPDSQILDSGREERLFTAAQTRAIIARDKHCQYPQCDAPPGEGEIHHSIWWYAQNGTTRVNDGVLVCWYHHDYIHRHTITITHTNNQWHFTRPDHTSIGPEVIKK